MNTIQPHQHKMYRARPTPFVQRISNHVPATGFVPEYMPSKHRCTMPILLEKSPATLPPSLDNVHKLSRCGENTTNTRTFGRSTNWARVFVEMILASAPGFDSILYLDILLYHSLNHPYIENSESAAVGSHGI